MEYHVSELSSTTKRSMGTHESLRTTQFRANDWASGLATFVLVPKVTCQRSRAGSYKRLVLLGASVLRGTKCINTC
jgi:hypothetical protein